MVEKAVDDPSDAAMSLHDSLSRMACKRKYLIKMMACSESAACRRKRDKEEKERCALYCVC